VPRKSPAMVFRSVPATLLRSGCSSFLAFSRSVSGDNRNPNLAYPNEKLTHSQLNGAD
jgi:hypothetical protein